MSLIKYNHPLNSLVDQFFNHNIGDFMGSDFVKSQPSVNVVEGDHFFKVDLAAPGLEKEDFNVSIEKDQLLISVEKEQESLSEDQKFTRREFGFYKFQRSFNLSDKVNKDAIEANYENGILSITLPKTEAAQIIKRNIEIS